MWSFDDDLPALKRITGPQLHGVLERDITGKPVVLWRCVNCCDFVDSSILPIPVPSLTVELMEITMSPCSICRRRSFSRIFW